MLSLAEYLQTAEKLLRRKSLKISDEAVGYVATYLMRADTSYKPTIGTREGWRIYYGHFGVLNWIRKAGNKSECSLDYEDHKGKSYNLMDLIPDNQPSVPNQVHYKNFWEDVERVRLTLKERNALNHRYLEDLTLEETGKKMGVSRQRVSQLLNKAHEKIKHDLRGKYGRSDLSSIPKY